jgi:hypothetical protein
MSNRPFAEGLNKFDNVVAGATNIEDANVDEVQATAVQEKSADEEHKVQEEV